MLVTDIPYSDLLIRACNSIHSHSSKYVIGNYLLAAGNKKVRRMPVRRVITLQHHFSISLA